MRFRDLVSTPSNRVCSQSSIDQTNPKRIVGSILRSIHDPENKFHSRCLLCNSLRHVSSIMSDQLPISE